MSAPTLIVGLGGTGSKIVRIVYERATEKQRESIRFVVFDTDVNELREIEESTPRIRVIQTSNRLTVGEYLDKDTFARDNWFPVNRILFNKALTEGAGQVRAISRLALDTAIQQGKIRPLDEAIEDLYKLSGQSTEQAPRVILAGSLCGGTGSGLILPISMYIRNFLTSKLQHGTASIRGFFLLPEVFESVIGSTAERTVQRANAYAAVKEISAFMLKHDEKLPEKFNPQFFAPRAGSQQLDEYKGSPMDFCFLFDAQNLNGERLNSFEEYKEHAANCIYGMAIAPTSQRSNSSEDNVIGAIVKGGGRNRFAGAGTSMLIYPTEDIENYLTLNWTRDTISKEWLSVDRRYAAERDVVKKARAQGTQVNDIDRGEHYTRVVDEGKLEGDIFCRNIFAKGQVVNLDNPIANSEKWVCYDKALENYISSRINIQMGKNKSVIDEIGRVETAAKNTKALGGEKDGSGDGEDKSELSNRYSLWNRQLQNFRNITETQTKDLAEAISFSLFKNDTDSILDDIDHDYYVEYWLHDLADDKQFIHPNAVRYLLYKISEQLRKRRKLFDKKVTSIKKDWNDFPKQFDDKETDVVETEADFYEKNFNRRWWDKVLHYKDVKNATAELNMAFSTFRQRTTEYWQMYVKSVVYDKAIRYVESLSEAFEQFYDVLDRHVPSLDRQIEMLEHKYSYNPGEARRYVCADETCMKGFASEVKNYNDLFSLPGEISRNIYAAMKKYALMDKKQNAESYCLDVFDDSIKDYLHSQIISQYESVVRMDILTAIGKEEEYTVSDEKEDHEIYAKHLLESAMRLATPFIESPVNEEPRLVISSTYSKNLHNENIGGREAFIKKYLTDKGGVEDDSVGPDMILFYKAVYNIQASNLSKFARPISRETFERTAGDYYKAYYEMVSDLNPDTTQSTTITPHIDKWWHVITKIPDLDDASQEYQENQVYTAFFWGIIGKYIKYKPTDNVHYVYYVNKPYLNLTSKDNMDELIVSNGTPCDHLYEVLDALTVYPKLVDTILKTVDRRIQNELYNKKQLEQTSLFEYLNSFEIEEKIQNTDPALRRSIFDLLMLMKWSVLPEEYFEDTMQGLLRSILEEIKQYIVHFCEKSEQMQVYTDLIMKQYKLFIENMTAEKVNRPNVFKDELIQLITDTLVTDFRSFDLESTAKEIEGLLNDAKK